MAITVKSAAIIGLDVFEINVEVDTINSIPQVSIIGLGDTAISEAKERLRLAIKNSSIIVSASSPYPSIIECPFSIMKAVHDAAAAVIPTGTRPGRR